VVKRNVGSVEAGRNTHHAKMLAWNVEAMTAMAKTVDIQVRLVSGIAVQKVIKALRCSLGNMFIL